MKMKLAMQFQSLGEAGWSLANSESEKINPALG
jgi:hypothetical protein